MISELTNVITSYLSKDIGATSRSGVDLPLNGFSSASVKTDSTNLFENAVSLLGSTEAEYDALFNSFEAASSENNAAQLEYNKDLASVSNQTKLVDDLAKAIEKSQQSITELSFNLNGLDAIITNFDNGIHLKTQAKNSFLKEKKVILDELKARDGAILNHNKAIDNLTKSVTAVDNGILSLEQKIAQLKTAKAPAAEIAKIENEVNKLKSQRAELLQKLSSAESKLSEILSKGTEKETDKIRKIDQQLLLLSDEIAGLKDQKTEKIKEAVALKEALFTKYSFLENQQITLQTQHGILEKLKTKSEKSKEKLETATEREKEEHLSFSQGKDELEFSKAFALDAKRLMDEELEKIKREKN